jgi:hypothetical protein
LLVDLAQVQPSGQSLRNAIDIVRIDDQRVYQFARRSGELAEHQYPGFVITGRNEFLRNQVHAVVKATHIAHVSRSVALEHVCRFHVSLEVGHRHELAVSKTSIDSGDVCANTRG